MAQPRNETPGSGRVLDISRLLSRLHRKAPTGIDRVELAYARHHLERAAAGHDTRFLLTTPVNTALLPCTLASSLIRIAIERWSPPTAEPAADPAYPALSEALQAPIRQGDARRTVDVTHSGPGAADGRMAAMKATAYAAATLRGMIKPHFVPSSVPAWYVHVSHINLHCPTRLSWFRGAGLRGMFLVHDLIPISHPEYFLPGEDERHRRRVETVSRSAAVVIFNSHATKAAWDGHAARTGLPRPRGEVVPLGIEDTFQRVRGGENRLDVEVPYFVVIGTMEARKNLTFLLQVWRQWTRDGTLPRARLVIVGRRGWESENVFDLLDRSPALASTIVEVAELGDVAMAALLRGARALLAPSLIEGFGLPIAEALSLGVPVIASDIEAHREVGGTFVEYVDPVDGPGWTAALEGYVQLQSTRRQHALLQARRYHAMTWADHIDAVEGVLAGG